MQAQSAKGADRAHRAFQVFQSGEPRVKLRAGYAVCACCDSCCGIRWSFRRRRAWSHLGADRRCGIIAPLVLVRCIVMERACSAGRLPRHVLLSRRRAQLARATRGAKRQRWQRSRACLTAGVPACWAQLSRSSTSDRHECPCSTPKIKVAAPAPAPRLPRAQRGRG